MYRPALELNNIAVAEEREDANPSGRSRRGCSGGRRISAPKVSRLASEPKPTNRRALQ